MYHFKNTKDLHYELLNTLSLICFDTGFYYCFCDKYQDCQNEYGQQYSCLLYQIPIEFRNFEEYLGRNQYNILSLKQFAFCLFPFLEECYKVHKPFLEAFSGHYTWSSRDWNTGEKSELSLKEIIEYNDYLKKLNGKEKYFNFFY